MDFGFKGRMPKPKHGKGIVNKGARLVKQLIREAATPNTWVRSTPPNPLPPPPSAVAGAILGKLGLAVGIWALVEGANARSVARASLSDIDPALLYPPSTEIIREEVPANFTGGQEWTAYKIYGSSKRDGVELQKWGHDFEVPGKIQSINFRKNYYDTLPDGRNTFTVAMVVDSLPEGRPPEENFYGLKAATYSASTGNYNVSSRFLFVLQNDTLVIEKVLKIDGGEDLGGNPPPLEGEQSSSGWDSFIPKIKIDLDLKIKLPPPLVPAPNGNTKSGGENLDNNPGGKTGTNDNSGGSSEDKEKDIGDTNNKNGLDNKTGEGNIIRRFYKTPDPNQSYNQKKTTTFVPSPAPDSYTQGAGGAGATGTEAKEGVTEEDITDINNGAQTPEQFLEEQIPENPLDLPDNFVQTPPPGDREFNFDPTLIPAIALAPNTLDQIKNGTREAICEETSPRGCLTSGVVEPINSNNSNNANILLNALNAFGQTLDLSLLAVINRKLGAEIPNGGISAFMQKAWEVARVDKIINAANLLVATHNAAMLSRNMIETLGDTVSAGLNLLGIKDAQGNGIDINEVIGNTMSGLINSLVPTEVQQNISSTWLKLNRIHAAAVGMASAVTQTKNAVLEVQETTANWIAQIGNTQQEQGIVEEDSYPWMQENNNFTDPYQGFLNKINNAEEVVSQASNFINSAIELQDSVQQISTSKEELNLSLSEFTTAKTEEETTKEAESESPDIANSDLIKSEE